MANAALANLTDALAAGQSKTLTDYLKAMARFHRYSWFNSILIYFQRPNATHVAGFAAWKKLGRSVKKGERGISILIPIIYKSKRGRPKAKEDEETVHGYTTGYVFDVSQTEGEPLPQFAQMKGDPGSRSQLLRQLIQEKGIQLEYVRNLGGAKGTSTGMRIGVLEGLSPAEEFQVLAHELAHELLHRGPRRSETTLEVRELEAEAVAFVVCHAVGLDTNTASSDYIALYQGNEKLLSQSLAHIQNSASAILDYIL
jgi:antirestriction protein ArdC